MASAEYTLLGPLYPAEKCYLHEVLLWRAFARLPEVRHDIDGGDWRFARDVLDQFEAPIPSGIELSNAECQFAGISPDPRYAALLEDRESFSLDHYERMIQLVMEFEPYDPELMQQQEENLEEAKAFHAEFEDWVPGLDDYVDQFKSEICLALRRGKITAHATLLPVTDFEECERYMEKENIWFDEFETVQVEKEYWISSGIDWDTGSLSAKGKSFIWVHFEVQDILKEFPPALLLEDGSLRPLAGNYALISDAVPISAMSPTNRGRPSLPWSDFHVEVARMFRDEQMPSKKEAAIAELQEWFIRRHQKSASRAAIGQRLKPYYDRLIRKDRK